MVIITENKLTQRFAGQIKKNKAKINLSRVW